MKRCLVCGQNECEPLIDFGPQPVCHHFYDPAHAEVNYPMALGQCRQCGVVQATPPVPPEGLVPYFDWISYNEPEAHLDDMVATLSKLPGITAESVIGGLSYKEASTLRRFRDRGFMKTWRLDPKADLEIENTRGGIESIQQRLSVKTTKRLRQTHEPADILIVRHMLEHTHDTPEFLRALRNLVKPDGYIVFEVPDCARGFDLLDYTTLWEDHTLYFVEPTLVGALEEHGLGVARFERYVAPYENCLVAIARAGSDAPVEKSRRYALPVERERALNFARGLTERSQAWRTFLNEKRQQGKIALLGAGHLAAVFINLLGLADLIDVVIDDHPQKRGRRMPGSKLEIVGSEALYGEKIALCLTSLGAESEKRVVRKHQAFVDAGGSFASVFPIERGQLVNFIAGPAQSP
jgi:hypothetical protein